MSCHEFAPGKPYAVVNNDLFEVLLRERLTQVLIDRKIYKAVDGRQLWELSTEEIESLYMQTLVGETIGQTS